MHWAFGLIDEDEFRTQALYGMYVVLLGIATNTGRPQILDQLHKLERVLEQLRAEAEAQSKGRPNHPSTKLVSIKH